jgi:PQQ-dependent catabolism-associated CXXCW motif protein
LFFYYLGLLLISMKILSKSCCICACVLSLSACESVNTAWDGAKDTLSNTFTPSAEPIPVAANPAPVPVPVSVNTASSGDPDAIEPIRSDQPLSTFTVENKPYAEELTNHGTPPVSGLIPAGYRAPTPTTLAGGKMISTYNLHKRLTGKNPPLLINALLGGSTELIPGSVWLSGAGKKGKFTDATQQQLGQELKDLTGGQTKEVIVFYCSGYNCWHSYNAALRAVNLGYRKVLWYRGGLQAWNAAGLPTEQSNDDRWPADEPAGKPISG